MWMLQSHIIWLRSRKSCIQRVRSGTTSRSVLEAYSSRARSFRLCDCQCDNFLTPLFTPQVETQRLVWKQSKACQSIVTVKRISWMQIQITVKWLLQMWKGYVCLKGVFSQERARFAKDVNLEKYNIRILGSKSSANIRMGLEASSIVCGMLETFARNFKLFWNSHGTKNDSHEQLTKPREQFDKTLHMFGDLLEPKIRMLNFAIFSTFASFANRSRSHENTPLHGF